MFWRVVSKDVRRRWVCGSEIGCCWKGNMNVWGQCVQDNAMVVFFVSFIHSRLPRCSFIVPTYCATAKNKDIE